MTRLISPRLIRWPLTVGLAAALVACGGEDPAKMVDAAKAAIDKRDANTAVIQLKSALQKEPQRVEARFLLGKVMLGMGDFVGAETELQKALDGGWSADQAVPLLAQALAEQRQFKRLEDKLGQTQLKDKTAQADLLTVLALSRRAEGQEERARATLEEALRVVPDHPPALVELARALAAARKFDEGMVHLDKVLSQRPDDADALKLKGDYLFFWKREYAEAIRQYELAVKARPRFMEAQSGVVRVRMNSGQLDEAQAAMDALRKMGEGRPVTLYQGAQLALLRDKLDDARKDAQRLLKLSPDNAWALELAGAIEFRANALVQAEPFLAKAIKADPELSLARRLLIQTYLKNGQIDKAMATLPDKLDALQDPDLLGMAGQVYLVQGNQSLAQKLFERAAQLAPQDPEKQTSLALSRLATGQAAQAFGDLRTIADRDKGIVADMALINALMQRRELDKAIDAVSKLEAKKPDDPTPKLLRAQILLIKGDDAGARQVLTATAQSAPKNFAPVKALAALDLQANKLADAEKRVAAFSAAEPKNAEALLSLIQLRIRSGAKEDDIRALFNRAIEVAPEEPMPRIGLVAYLLKRDPKKALTTAQSAVAVMPGNLIVQDALGQAQAAAGESNQALNTYGKLATMQPGSVVPYMRMASIHVAAKNTSEAAAVLRKALEVKPDSLDAQRGLAELALRNNSVADALTMTRNIQKQRPKEAVGFLMEGEVFLYDKKYDEALKAFTAAKEREPNSTAIALKIQALYLRAGKRAEADKFADGWLVAHPKDMLFRSAMGNTAMLEGNFPLAEKMFRQVLQLKPDDAVVLNNLGWVLTQQGSKEALTHVERANTLMPNNADILDTLATVLANDKQLPRALEAQRKAIQLQPERPEFKLALAKLMIQSGDKAGAKATLQTLQKLGSQFAGQKDVEALLKSM